MATAIEFENVGKQYRLGLVSTGTLSHDIKRWWTVNVRHKEDPYLKIGDINDRSVKGSSDYVWALKDINFKVEQGDVVGIIGRNGAGKSTLLKLLSKVTAPTTGHIRGVGRIGSLLEVGTGFHPEMTGRENIFMNGAILGMTKPEIARKLDEIVDFSGCERYLDTPVKRYSSGMMVRLGFAVAAHLDPEILVVDEVLAVGDAEFQKKAIGKMKDVSQGEGRTVLFVSHNMASVNALCQRGIIMDKGSVIFQGTAAEAVQKYISGNVQRTKYLNTTSHPETALELLCAEVYPDSGECFQTSEPINVDFTIRVNRYVHNIVVGFNIMGYYFQPLARVDFNDFSGVDNLLIGTYSFHFQIPADTLSDGNYQIKFDVAEMNIKNYASDESMLSINVSKGLNSNINAYNENAADKRSVIRENWLKSYQIID